MMYRPPAARTFSASSAICFLEFVVGVLEQLAGGQDLLVVGVGVAGGFVDDLVAVAGLAQFVLGKILGVAAQHDIGTAAGHVGGYGDGAELAGLGDDLRFLLMVLGVEHVVLDALALEHAGEQLVLLDGHGADQHRLSFVVAFLRSGRITARYLPASVL